MHKQIKQIAGWFSRARVLLFVLIFSMVLLGSVIVRFALQNNWLEVEFANQVRTTELNNQVTMLRLYIKNAESGERGYAISGDRIFVEKFDATIDSIRATYKQVQQLDKRNEDDSDVTLFLKSDSLIQQKIAFMQRVKMLCDNNNRKAAMALIATHKGLNLSDSITKINNRINSNILSALKKSQTGFLKISSRNNKLAYIGIAASMLLIVMVFYFLILEIRRKKRISDELRMSKEHFKVTLNSLGEGLITTDKKGDIVYMNPAAEQLTGWNWQEAKKQPLQNVYDVVNEETGRPFENIASRIIKQGKIIEMENNTILKAKHTGSFIISNSGAPLLDSLGNISGAVVVFNDNTEKNKIEGQLKNSEEKYRLIFERITDCFLSLDDKWRYTYLNEKAASLLNKTPEELIGKNIWEENPEWVELPFQKVYFQAIEEQKYFYHEEYNPTWDKWFETHVYPSSDGISVFFRDITERKKNEQAQKESEEKYRNLVEQASDAILIYSFDGTIHEFNKACYTMLGYSKEEYAKLKLTDILVDDIVVNQYNYAAILAGEIKTLYRNLMRKDGSLMETEVTVKMLTDGKAIAIARDVTERKKAEQLLRESEIFSKSILTSINYHIAVIEANGNIISVNKAWDDFSIANGETVLERTGVGSNYIEVCSVSAGGGDTSAAKALNGFQQVIQKEIPFFEMEYPCDSVDEQRWFLLRIVNFSDDSPKVVMMHIDITELKKAGEIVSRNEKKFRTLIENNNGIIALVDKNFKTIYRSPSVVRVTGWTVDELASMGIENIIHPDDRDLLKNTWAGLIANPGKLHSLSIRSLHKNGNYIFLEGTAINLLDDENVKAIVTNMRDVTERKNAELVTNKAIERYDILADATSDTIWDWDIVNNTMIYNDGISKIFGYKASEIENVVDWWNEKLHSEDFEKVIESLGDIFEKGVQRFQLTYRFRCADGSYKNIFDRAFVLFDESGKPIRMIGAMQDITYQVEEEIRTAKAIIDAQEQERNFLGAELHDNINQILAGTLLTLGMTKSKEVDTSRKTGFINDAMGYITDALNETRKLSHHLAPVSFEDISLKDLFENLLVNLNLDNQFSINFYFDEITETTLPNNIQINLYRILQEQTKNIIKYAEASVIEIAVILSGNTLSMRIFDNGKGFNTKTTKKGIGLSNIKKRAESLSGKFILNSAPDKGCEIIVEIPLDK